MSFQGDPYSRLEERAGVHHRAWKHPQAECSLLGLCLRTVVTLKLWAGQTHLQPNRVALHQSEPPYPLMILPQKPTTGYL